MDLHHDYRASWPLYVRVRSFYVQYFSELTGHYGEGLCILELFVQIRELHFDCVHEERFRSLSTGVEVRRKSGKREVELAPIHSGKLPGCYCPFLAIEEN